MLTTICSVFFNQPDDAVQTIKDHGKSDSSTQQSDSTMDEAAGQTEPTDTNEDRGVGRSQAQESQGHSGESTQIIVSSSDDAGMVYIRISYSLCYVLLYQVTDMMCLFLEYCSTSNVVIRVPFV